MGELLMFKFKSVDAYREWRSHWRRDYAIIGSQLHRWKVDAKKPTNNMEEVARIHALIRKGKMVARTMMMAREAVEGSWTRRRKLAWFHAWTEFMGKRPLNLLEHKKDAA
jgi:hypothetical protein